MAQAELVLGELSVLPAYPSGLPYQITTLAELDLGNPEPNVAEVQSFLEDGSLAQVINYGNRQPVLRVRVTGATLDDLAAGEKAIMAEVNRGRNELVWTPPDSIAAETSVFDVVWTRLDFSFDEMNELHRRRTFVLTLTCLPWARPTTKTLVESIASGGTPPTPVTTTVDDCSSTTGWSRPAGYPLGSSAGAVSTGTIGIPGAINLSLTRTGAVSMAGTPYLMVDWASGGPGRTVLDFRVYADGVLLPRISSATSPIYGTRSFYSPPNIVSTLRFESSLSVASSGAPQFPTDLTIAEITRTNVSPFVGNGRQQFRSMVIPGSAPTTGSIQVADDTESLGYVAVYTNVEDQSGYQPPCRNLYRVAGTTPTADPTAASGAWSKLNGATPETFDIPARALPPGTYQVMALLRLPVAGFSGCNWESSTRVGTTDLGVETKPNIIYAEPAGTLCDLGQVTLPSVGLPLGSSGMVRMKLSSNSTTLEIDDLYLFNLSTGALTLVSAGTGTPTAGGASSRLWIKAPSTDSPNPTTWLGTLADESDSRHTYGSKERTSLGTHVLTPGTMNVFTLTTGATYAAVSAEFYRRYHSNVMAE